VKLLLDQNLSFRLINYLDRRFPGSEHVRTTGLDRATDLEVWQYARQNGFVILSKDGDFHHLCLLHGAPPKVVWLRAGNTSTETIMKILDAKTSMIEQFVESSSDALLVIDGDI
jgi:predicted nuclease of predicted toxin-antitoxin system